MLGPVFWTSCRSCSPFRAVLPATLVCVTSCTLQIFTDSDFCRVPHLFFILCGWDRCGRGSCPKQEEDLHDLGVQLLAVLCGRLCFCWGGRRHRHILSSQSKLPMMACRTRLRAVNPIWILYKSLNCSFKQPHTEHPIASSFTVSLFRTNNSAIQP